MQVRRWWQTEVLQGAPGASLGLVLLVAAALRIYDIAGEPLSSDEAWTVAWLRLDQAAFWQAILDDFHPPTYFWALEAWTTLFGQSPAALRMFSVLPGVATVAAIHALAARQYGPRTGLLAASLVAVTPVAIHYSQEARSYAWAMLWITLSTHAFLQRRAGRRQRSAYLLFTALALYTHFVAVFVVIAQNLVAFATDRRTPREWITTQAFLAATWTPGIALTFWQTLHRAALDDLWARPTLRNIAEAPPQFFGGSIIAAIVIMAAAAVPLLRRDRGPAEYALATTGAGIVLVPFVASLFTTPIFAPRIINPAVLPLLILAARGFSLARGQQLFAIIAIALVAAPLAPYYADQQNHDWPLALEAVERGADPGATVWLANENLRYAYAYYVVRDDLAMELQPPSALPPDFWAISLARNGVPPAVEDWTAQYGPPEVTAVQGLRIWHFKA